MLAAFCGNEDALSTFLILNHIKPSSKMTIFGTNPSFSKPTLDGSNFFITDAYEPEFFSGTYMQGFIGLSVYAIEILKTLQKQGGDAGSGGDLMRSA